MTEGGTQDAYQTNSKEESAGKFLSKFCVF